MTLNLNGKIIYHSESLNHLIKGSNSVPSISQHKKTNYTCSGYILLYFNFIVGCPSL